jgi:glycosyltransferase involved in cell wall biosynthesis
VNTSQTFETNNRTAPSALGLTESAEERRSTMQRSAPTILGSGLNWLGPVVLIIDSAYPRPDRDSGSLDAINFIEMFQSFEYQVVFIAAGEFSLDTPARNAIEALGVYCVSTPEYASVEDFLRAAASELDICFLSRVDSGGHYVEMVKRLCWGAKIIFNTVDLHHVREEREARLKQDRRALNVAHGTRERELAIARLADATIVVSREEESLLHKAIPGFTVCHIPLARDCPGRVNGYAERQGIGFIGGFGHPPNIDAVHYFLDTIWPGVRARLPGVEFRVMGSDMPDEIRNRTAPGFVAVGYVPDLTEQMERIRVMVAPLRFGAGVKGKVASSLAHGVPCVATPIAAEGMGLADGRTILVADTPEAFCESIVTAYTDEQVWTELSDGGTEFIAENYSFTNGRRLLGEMLWGLKLPMPDEWHAQQVRAVYAHNATNEVRNQ